MAGHGGERLRTLIVDSDPLVRLGLLEALDRDGSFAVIGESASPPTWEELLAFDALDLVLLSGRLPEPEAVDAVTDVVAAGQRVVVYGDQASDISLVSAVLAAGCSAYVSTQATSGEIARVLENLLSAGYAPTVLRRAAGHS
jgi:DNA-binding NarL/FixJ family response regulator